VLLVMSPKPRAPEVSSEAEDRLEKLGEMSHPPPRPPVFL
jgi:hypothetical protein